MFELLKSKPIATSVRKRHPAGLGHRRLGSLFDYSKSASYLSVRDPSDAEAFLHLPSTVYISADIHASILDKGVYRLFYCEPVRSIAGQAEIDTWHAALTLQLDGFATSSDSLLGLSSIRKTELKRTSDFDMVYSLSKLAAKSLHDADLGEEVPANSLLCAVNSFATWLIESKEDAPETSAELESVPSVPARSKEQLLEMVSNLIASRNQEDLYGGTFIYGITVVSPLNLIKKVNAERLAAVVPKRYLFSCMRGQIPHEVVYGVDRDQLGAILGEVLSKAEIIEIAISHGVSEVSRERFHVVLGRAEKAG